MKHTRLPALFLFLIIVITVQLEHGLQGSQSAVQNQAPRAQSQDAGTGDTERDEGIKHLLVQQVEAWNRGELEGFMGGYWRSPDLTFFSGATISNGWQAALNRYKSRYQGTGKEMGHLEFQDLGINLLSRQAAFVTGKWELTMSD